MEGKAYVEPPPVSQWPLHLKEVTLLDVDAVFAMETQREETKRFLKRAFVFMTPEPFSGLRTSRTIKTTKLSSADLERAISLRKFERCPRPVATDGVLHKGVHGVNIFAVPEMKGRRRCIGEPHLNTLVPKSVLPVLHHPSRLDTRQALKDARYCLQIDFVAYYDAIPLQQCMRDHFVFRQGRNFFRLCTLPTGARWSVAVGQAVTWTITDVPTRTTIITCIDNIMIAAAEHLKTDFLATVRAILRRIKRANLLTTPDREELLLLSDSDLLCLAEKDSCFLGEGYHWDGSQRLVKNSIKTIAKLKLGLAKPWYTRRTYVSLVSLIMYALHTTRINPSEAFYALRAYRGVYSDVSKGADWDGTLPSLTESALSALLTAGILLLDRGWDPIVRPIKATTNEQDYDVVCFTDASGAGWGAVAVEEDGITRTYQQRWIHEVDFSKEAPRKSTAERFTARYSAHTEPHGIAVYLQRLLDRGFQGPATIAIVTDHSPIVFAQRKHNGFGGIGRGFELESLYRLTNTMLHEHNIAVVFFYIKGEFNPADSFSRHFGEDAEDGALVVREGSCLMPESEGNTFSPMCEVAPGRGYCGDVVHSSVRK